MSDTPENAQNNDQNEPSGSKVKLFGLDISTRGLISLAFVGTACYAVIANIVIPDWFTTLVVGVVGFYYGHSVGSNNGKL